MANIFDDKVILVTGGTGSFGKKFVEVLLREHKPRVIRIYSRGEHKQVDMEREFHDDRLRFFIGDVRDKVRLQRAMNDVDIVVHAAALKHVPVCEYNPIEAIKTNIVGAENVINAAIDSSVDKVIALSTDKAVQPVNLYGSTKLVAEKLFVQANSYVGSKDTRFSCVRYGNVIGSNGSVIPLFKKQRDTGEVSITDMQMTRFWITLEQGAKFVMQSLELMKGGEIFIPKLPSTRISDLADIMAPEAKKKVIGIRPGEKLHEILITPEEARHTKEFDNHYLIEPEHAFWKSEAVVGGKHVPADFSYISGGSKFLISKDKIKSMLSKEGWI